MQDTTLARFRTLVGRFTQHQDFISRAHDAGDRYTPAVIERVIRDHRKAMDEMIPELVVAYADAEDAFQILNSERNEAADEAARARHVSQMYELRVLIGEMDVQLAEDKRAPFLATEARKQPVVDYLDGRLSGYREALQDWYRVGVAAGVLKEQVLQPA